MGLRICISNKLPSDVNDAGLWTVRSKVPQNQKILLRRDGSCIDVLKNKYNLFSKIK